MHKVNDRYYFQFPGLEFIQLPEGVRRLAFPRTRMGEFSEQTVSWKIVGTDERQCRYIRGRYPYVCRTKQGIKHVTYGELVGNIEYMSSQPRCRTNRGRYNRVQPYLRNFRPLETKAILQTT